MNKKKCLLRVLCLFLSVLLTVCAIPALAVFADPGEEAGEGGEGGEQEVTARVLQTDHDYTRDEYLTEDARLADMVKYYDNGTYSLYCDEVLGTVAYRKNATGEVLFTNPYNMKLEVTNETTPRAELMSQILLKYRDAENNEKTLNSYADAAMKGQMSVKKIKGGLRVEYAIGEISARILLPVKIEVNSLKENILDPMDEANRAAAMQIRTWYNMQSSPKYDEKHDLYYYALDPKIKNRIMRTLEGYILAYCPQYSFEKMDEDYDLLGYEDTSTAAPVFRAALEYKIDEYGLSVSLSGNGLRYDETAYRVLEFSILPYMGACYKKNEGYSFYPDGSGTLYLLNVETDGITGRVYGNDYAFYQNLIGTRTQVMRMPVFGQVETDADTGVSRGFVGFIEEGDAMATLVLNHSKKQFSSIYPRFLTRPYDTPKSSSNLSVYAYRRYVDDYRLRYVILSDATKAATAGLANYYECSWIGMATAYRDYLDATSETFNRLTADDVQSSIPLYLEVFGCMDTIKKVASVPVTVSVPLTSFEDVSEMYAYLAGHDVTNVNFKLKGFANGGLYSEVPYKLKWQSSVGGKSGFKKLVAEAKEKGFGIYPDFDFVYTTGGKTGRAVKMKKNAARTIDNRYTTKRVYSVTMQGNTSYFQMVLSPATYSKFYEKLVKRYSKYENATGVSLATLGSDLNSDFDENKTVLREEAKEYVMEAISYFKENHYDVMVNGGNAYTWTLADHILDVALDSSRYKTEYRMVPFIGVVLHGYVPFAGTALNMEGNLTYAMLKAIESGAGLYYILSYENTELLKEDLLLSENYSVRYDIWRNRLVKIYTEINAVLADVQTKLIIDHKFLDATRVPDADELFRDIEEAAVRHETEIEAQKAKQVDMQTTVAQTLVRMRDNLAAVQACRVSIENGRVAVAGPTGTLRTAWLAAIDEIDATGALTVNTKMALIDALSSDVLDPYVRARRIEQSLDQLVVNTKKNYDDLKRADVADDVLAEVHDQFVEILDLYAAIKTVLNSQTYAVSAADKAAYIDGDDSRIQALTVTVTGDALTVDDADVIDYVFGNDATVNATYANIGVFEVETAFKAALRLTGVYDADNNVVFVDYGKMKQDQYRALTVIPQAAEEQAAGNENAAEAAVADDYKYAVDNSVVLVTYGEKNTPFKSIILNFNDYAVTTVVDGTTYHVAAYDYVIIYH